MYLLQTFSNAIFRTATYAAVDKISTDIVRRAVCATTEFLF